MPRGFIGGLRDRPFLLRLRAMKDNHLLQEGVAKRANGRQSVAKRAAKQWRTFRKLGNKAGSTGKNSVVIKL